MKKIIATMAVSLMALGSYAYAGTTVCLITKTDSNPFFVKMKEGAQAKADELGMTLKAFAGKIEGDNETQVAAIETCILDGAKGGEFRLSLGSTATRNIPEGRYVYDVLIG